MRWGSGRDVVNCKDEILLIEVLSPKRMLLLNRENETTREHFSFCVCEREKECVRK